MTGLVDAEYCCGCVYAGRQQNTATPANCDYFLITGKRRPCPAGEGCTVRVKGLKPKNHLIVKKPPRTTLTNCPNCGAPVDLNADACAFCDTPYTPRTSAAHEAALRSLFPEDYGNG